MRVLITGANGFLGQALTAAICQRGALSLDERLVKVTALLLVDQVTPASSHVIGLPNAAICVQSGDLAKLGFVRQVMSFSPDIVFHLAAALTLTAERDDHAAFELNIACLHTMIQQAAPGCRLVYPSSISVFGGALPEMVDDSVAPAPQTTYGTHKVMAELMLADASRKARLSARCLRLPIVLVRDPGPQPTVSDHVAAIIREPLQGRDFFCGLRPDTRMPVASVSAVAQALIQLGELSERSVPVRRVMNLPSLTATPAQMVQAVARCGSILQMRPLGQVRFGEDAQLQTIVDSWPRQFDSAHARVLGIRADASIDDIVNDYLHRKSGQPDGQRRNQTS